MAPDALPVRPTDHDGVEIFRTLPTDVFGYPERKDAYVVERRLHGIVGHLWKQVCRLLIFLQSKLKFLVQFFTLIFYVFLKKCFISIFVIFQLSQTAQIYK